MKHVSLAAGLVSLLLSSTAFADLSDMGEWGIKPNIGIDAGFKNQDFDAGFGEEHFRDDYPVTNIYIGAKLHQLFGVEVGFEEMYRQQKRAFYNEGATALGFFNPGQPEQKTFISDVYAKGWNLNLLGFWPICPRTKTELTGTIGVTWQKMYYNTTAIGNVSVFSPSSTPVTQWDSDSRAMFRAGVGLRQMITKHFGSRLQVMWEDTSKLGATTPVDFLQGGVQDPVQLSDSYTVSPDDSWSVMLGFFFQIT